MSIDFKSHVDDVLDSLISKKDKALEMCGILAEGYAKENLTKSGAVDTGNLRNSVAHQSVGDTMYVGTNVEYGVYVELGTGIYTSGGRQTPWVYKDAQGKWHRTRGMQARPFIKPAAANHGSEYNSVIEDVFNSD